MSPTLFLLLRVLHIVAGAFWVGAVLLLTIFLLPSISAVGPAGGPVMHQLGQVRRLPIWLMVASVVTLLAGFALYWAAMQSGGPAWAGSGPGRVLGLGGALALAAGILGMVVNAPAGKRLGALGATLAAERRPPTPEEAALMQRLQDRLTRASWVAVALLLLATVAMAVGRYVG
ncbi:MAG TPA: hypothetical protein VFK09_04525 [Gemmatimonadales bacterium]|nr:hypothetical protein [Gemmatimonadales bacterium]